MPLSGLQLPSPVTQVFPTPHLRYLAYFALLSCTPNSAFPIPQISPNLPNFSSAPRAAFLPHVSDSFSNLGAFSAPGAPPAAPAAPAAPPLNPSGPEFPPFPEAPGNLSQGRSALPSVCPGWAEIQGLRESPVPHPHPFPWSMGLAPGPAQYWHWHHSEPRWLQAISRVHPSPLCPFLPSPCG